MTEWMLQTAETLMTLLMFVMIAITLIALIALAGVGTHSIQDTIFKGAIRP